MVHRISLFTLSAIMTALLLAACSKQDNHPAASAPQAALTQDDTGAENGLPLPATDLWPVIAPLVAGSYSGECSQVPLTKTASGTITVGSDGKARGPGVDIDVSKSREIMLARTLQDDGLYGAQAHLSHDIQKLELVTSTGALSNMASLITEQTAVQCRNASAMPALQGKALYVTLAPLLDVAKQKMKCSDSKNLLATIDTSLEIRQGVATIADQQFALDKAKAENLTSSDDGAYVYAVTAPGKPLLNLMYNGRGRIAAVMGLDIGGKKYICSTPD